MTPRDSAEAGRDRDLLSAVVDRRNAAPAAADEDDGGQRAQQHGQEKDNPLRDSLRKAPGRLLSNQGVDGGQHVKSTVEAPFLFV